MSEIIVIGYDCPDRATSTLDCLRRREGLWLELNDVAAVGRDARGSLLMPELRRLAPTCAIPWTVLWRDLLHPPSAAHPATGTPSRRANAIGVPGKLLVDANRVVARSGSALIIWARTPASPQVFGTLRQEAVAIARSTLTDAQHRLLVGVLDVMGPAERRRA